MSHTIDVLPNQRPVVKTVTRIHLTQKGQGSKGGMIMLTIEALLTIIGVCITCFMLGYEAGKKQK